MTIDFRHILTVIAILLANPALAAQYYMAQNGDDRGGLNDIPGQSCFDVHKRLNVNNNGCNLPSSPTCNQPSGTPPVGDGLGTAGGSACCQ